MKTALKYTIVVSVIVSFAILILIISETERLPIVGSDSGNWGNVLNAYLSKEHTENGSHRNVTVA